MESTLISFNSGLSFWYDDYCFLFKFNGKKFVKKKKRTMTVLYEVEKEFLRNAYAWFLETGFSQLSFLVL